MWLGVWFGVLSVCSPFWYSPLNALTHTHRGDVRRVGEATRESNTR